MSLIFTHYDRTHACNHTGMLGRPASDGSRMCVRCGKTVRPEKAETFTRPVGRAVNRRPTTRKVG
jgi:hypothetical protein